MKLNLTIIAFWFTFNGFAQVNCDLTLQTTIENFNVYHHNPSGATMYKAKMAIDADGSPRAYGPNNTGLDWTANAGYPGNWWGVVTDSNGDPIIQGPGDPYPGMYVSTTSLVNSAYGVTNPLRYTNSETVPFFVLPSAVVSLGGIRIGDVGYVYNTQTGQGCFAIYADAGPSGKLGEGSIYLAQQIGINSNPRTGGTSLGIIDYIIFPYSGYGQGTIPTIAQIDSIGNAKLAELGGFAVTQCLEPNPGEFIPPTTQISVPANWDTTNFVVNFSDLDNTNGSGIEKSFYSVSGYFAGEWLANNNKGFFNDNFNTTSINNEWTVSTGTWFINSNHKLEQSDESLSNTNIYAPLTQNLSNRYLYHWKASMSGSGSNRRAGFHFFADQPDSSNRGNSYFVWFRLNDQKIQIYKVINNSWGTSPVKDTTYSFVAGQEYDFKVIYDRITGIIRVYINDILSAQWVDSSPISNGSYVSFRSGNCNYKVDDFEVFRSRNSTAIISVGPGNANDIRYQNENPTSPAGRISSITTDNAKNISNIAVQTVNIDWTPPTPFIVNDGNGADLDTVYTSTHIQANWNMSTDINSDIVRYLYAVGTLPGANDVVDWTNNGLLTNISFNTINLQPNQTYYVSVKAQNGAGMYSSAIISDGIIYLNQQVVNELHNASFNIFPNPADQYINIQTDNLLTEKICIYNSMGILVKQLDCVQTSNNIDLSNLPLGWYLIKFGNHYKQFFIVR